MTTFQKNTTAQAVKIWLDLTFVIGGLFCLFLAAWLVLSPLLMSGFGQRGDVAVRVSVGSDSLWPVQALDKSEPASGAAADDLSRPHLVKARGELRAETSNWLLHVLAGMGHLVGAIVVLWVIYLLRAVVRTALAGRPFATANARRLRVMAVILITAGVVLPTVQHLVARMVLARIHIESVSLSPAVEFRVDPILGGLLVLVLAAVFEHGRRLEDDQSLTV